MPLLRLSGKIGGGCLGIFLFFAIVWFISSLIWGGAAYLVWDTFNLHSAFHAGTIDYFWEAVGVGAALSLVLG